MLTMPKKTSLFLNVLCVILKHLVLPIETTASNTSDLAILLMKLHLSILTIFHQKQTNFDCFLRIYVT